MAPNFVCSCSCRRCFWLFRFDLVCFPPLFVGVRCVPCWVFLFADIAGPCRRYDGYYDTYFTVPYCIIRSCSAVTTLCCYWKTALFDRGYIPGMFIHCSLCKASCVCCFFLGVSVVCACAYLLCVWVFLF